VHLRFYIALLDPGTRVWNGCQAQAPGFAMVAMLKCLGLTWLLDPGALGLALLPGLDS
jgi:hypothetical protein